MTTTDVGSTTTVGVRELRDHLSKYLALVDDGGEVVITDHGRVRARILRADQETVMERLIREGKVRPPSRPKGKLRPGVRADGPNYVPGTPVASDLIER